MTMVKELAMLCSSYKLQGFKTFSCSTELSMQFLLLITIKMLKLTIFIAILKRPDVAFVLNINIQVGIFKFISRIKVILS